MKSIKTVTLVDDDEVSVYLTKKTIEKTNLVDLIKVFDNGLDALNYIIENKSDNNKLPEIILLDLSMPIMDGWQFLEEFRKVNPVISKKITIYICTSSISPDDVARAKAISEVTDFIIKPVTADKFMEMLRKM